MDRHTYIQTLQSAAFELLGLHGEWITDDGEYLDDEVSDELDDIINILQDFIRKLKLREATVEAITS